jgi:aminoglycoside phosphotransferase (APT) family kinase protein
MLNLLPKTRAIEYVKQHLPSVELEIVESGYENLIIIAGEQVFRFPNTEASWNRDKLECVLFKVISERAVLPIPNIIRVSDNPPFAVISKVHGSHYSEDLAELSYDDRVKYARQLAQFANKLHDSIDSHTFKKLKQDNEVVNDPIDDWELYMSKFLLDCNYLSHAQQAAAAEGYYIWRENLTKQDRTLVVHDDLHTGNVFVDGGRITGVIDFGDCTVGSAEQELRQLYRADSDTLKAGIDEYNRLSSKKIDFDVAKNWSIVHEIAVYSKSISNAQTDSHAFSRSKNNLAKWLPEIDWELADITTIS